MQARRHWALVHWCPQQAPSSERVWCRGLLAALLLVPTERSAAVPPKNPPERSLAQSAAEHLRLARVQVGVPSERPLLPGFAQAVLHCPRSLARSAAVLPKNLPVLAVLMVQSAVESLSLAQTQAMALSEMGPVLPGSALTALHCPVSRERSAAMPSEIPPEREGSKAQPAAERLYPVGAPPET
jgi:hypothetical protein